MGWHVQWKKIPSEPPLLETFVSIQAARRLVNELELKGIKAEIIRDHGRF